ncbi:uncharacterized protein [Apostichopus japonicus]|uniref:uncharacterized protein isoform X3 n=1 Tax=Stichopus japonicus TaxID=307972 RepID=UPI003AB87553
MDSVCTVVNQVNERSTKFVKEAQQQWKEREELICNHRKSLSKLWNLVHEAHSLNKDHSDTLEYEEAIDVATDTVEDIVSELKVKNKRLRMLHSNLSSQKLPGLKICPLFAPSWHPTEFYKKILDFSSLTLKVILNPGSREKPKTFEEGALMYYDTYFAQLTTFTIPTVDSFKITGQAENESCNEMKPQKKRGRKKEGRESTTDQAPSESDLVTHLKVVTLEEAVKKQELHHIPDDELGEKVREVVIADRKGKRANAHVTSIIEKWGVEQGEKMMIMSELKFHDNSKGELTNYNGDFDVFIISQRYGILFFQVKGVEARDNSNTQNVIDKVQDAWKQVLKDVAFLRESNRDLPFMLNVSVHTYVAVPNITKDDLDTIGICPHHRRTILCGGDMEDILTFDSWMKDRLSNHDDRQNCFSNEDYRLICSRYLALVAKVNFPSRATVIKKTRGLVSATNYGNKDKLWAILTPEQLQAIYDQESLKLITGEFGTGKSLMLVTKAKQLAVAECFVYLITFAGVGTDVNCYHQTNCFSVQQLRMMMGEIPTNIRLCEISEIITEYLRTNTEPWTAITGDLLEELFQFMSKRHSGNSVHFLFDEVPCYMFQSCHQTLIDLARKYKDSCLWFVLATHSHKATQFQLSDSQWFKTMMSEGYSYTPLTSSMRVPANVYQMVQIIRGNEDPTSAKKQRCGHVVDGPKPLVFIMPECICPDEIKCESIFACNCLVDRMKETVKKIFQILDPTGAAIESSEYSILVGCFVGTSFQHDLCTNLRQAFRLNKKELMFNLTSAANAKLPPPNAAYENVKAIFNVYDRYTYIGCENSVIIDIDPYSLHQCGFGNQWTYATMPFTRTVSQYVLFTWPKDEASRLWHSDLRGHDDLTVKRVESGQITEEMRDIRYKMTASARQSRGECLDKLISSNAVIVHPVSLPKEV